MKFSIVHDSRIGCRNMNQDRLNWAQTDDAVLLVLCDGMGGHRHGEIAAQLAVQRVCEIFRRVATPYLADPLRFLTDAITQAHAAINDYAAQRAIPLNDAPRTTCVVCVVQDGIALWAHVGDSRLYHLRAGDAVSRTTDHSRVQMLLDAGEITADEAARHPQRNLVYNCLGGDAPPRIDVAKAVRLEPDDIIALCSDGAWAPVADRFPAAFALPLQRAVPLLLDAAEAAAGPTCDNLSLIALRWECVASELEAETMQASAISTLVEDFAGAQAAAGSGQGQLFPSGEALTEADIDRAVADIRARIQQANTNKPTGVS